MKNRSFRVPAPAVACLYVMIALASIATRGVAAEIKIGGGGAAMSTVFAPVAEPFEKATGIHLVVLQSTPKDGLVSLLKGETQAAAAAVPIESMVKGAEADGQKVDTATLKSNPVATNRTILLVHKDNPVGKLNKEQIKGIFTGKIVNWKEVGGKDLAIIVVWGKNTPGQNAQLVKTMLDGATVTKEVLESGNYAKVRSDVAANAEAVGIDPLGMVDGTVKAVETEPAMTSPIIVVTKGDPSPEVQKLIDFVKGDGAKYVRK
ncbi:MAG TPA: substrate-binding domain-containing protein [Candidatus Deferrimicrobiaceae bacterium]|jgi:phosphate transport system substrate-binding protein